MCRFHPPLLGAVLGATVPAAVALTDWCEVARGSNISFTNATGAEDLERLLKGRVLSVGAMLEPPWLEHDKAKEGGCAGGWCTVEASAAGTERSAGPDGQLSGIDVDMMKLIAEYGGFIVQYHFEEQPTNWTWTDMLIGNAEKGNRTALIDKYDLIAGGGWIDTAARRKKNVHFTSSVNDQGIVLAVAKPHVPSAGLWEKAWYWVKPFTGDAYLVVLLGAWIFPATLVTMLEKLNNDDFQEVKWVYAMRTVFRRSFLNIIGFGDFEWAGHWASRFIMMFWGMAVLVVVTSYTANMTAFLVISKQATSDVKNVDEFIAHGRVACLPLGWGANDPVRARWRYLKWVELPAAEISGAVIRGEQCQGTLMPKDYLQVMLNGGPPRLPPPGCKDGRTRGEQERSPECEEYGCQLMPVGQTEVPLSGAFPAGRVDDDTCRWLPLQVVSSIITSLAEKSKLRDAFQDQLTAQSLHASGDPKCTPEEVESSKGGRITARHLVSVMLCCCGPMVVFFSWGFATTMVRRRDEEEKARKEEIAQQQTREVLKLAKVKFDLLDTDRGGTLNGSELEGLASYVDVEVARYEPGSNDAEEIIRDQQCTTRLRKRIADGHDVTWQDFSDWFARMRQAEPPDPLEKMKMRDASAAASAGQIVTVMELLLKMDERLTSAENTGRRTQREVSDIRLEQRRLRGPQRTVSDVHVDRRMLQPSPAAAVSPLGGAGAAAAARYKSPNHAPPAPARGWDVPEGRWSTEPLNGPVNTAPP